MSTAKILVSFGVAGAAMVDKQDFEPLRYYPWRIDPYGYVVRSGPPRGKGRISLARSVADLAGVPAGTIGFRNGKQLDCTRANLFVRGAAKSPTGPRIARRLQPDGVHRRVILQDSNGGLPVGWLLYYHDGDCVRPPSDHSGCVHPAKTLVGSSMRLTSPTTRQSTFNRGGHTSPAGWEFTDCAGNMHGPLPFYDGCVLLVSIWLSTQRKTSVRT